MTEKRFTNHITKTDADGTIHTDGIFDANENNKILITNYFYIAQVMNELHNENEQLKSENEILKRKLKTYHSGNQTIHQTLKGIRKENQEIKNTIQEAYKNERTDLGRSVLKQLIENIGE